MGAFRAIFDVLLNPTKVPLVSLFVSATSALIVQQVLVTLDALGTVYKFRKPLAHQYLQVARECGVTAKVDINKLDEAFKFAYADVNARYPNYGKGHERIANPEEWWNRVVTEAFAKFVPGGKSGLPSGLGPAMYRHFSTSKAYEPFPDVGLFLESMAKLKHQYTAHDGPLILTGIITNSDPRVESVLRDMGFRLGPRTGPTFGSIKQKFREDVRDIASNSAAYRDMTRRLSSPYAGLYNINNDFDLLITSYDHNEPKPSPVLWVEAEQLAKGMLFSRAEDNPDPNDFFNVRAVKYHVDHAKKVRIHVGDEIHKDYLGATNAEWDALHLQRHEDPEIEFDPEIQVVKSLDEAAMVVNVMANGLLKR
jgi:FMN phosphatase YigB (HAD superfamily)